jgi:hypothetical protein
VVEQLIRNQQVEGSNPPAGSMNIKGLAEIAYPSIIMGYHLGYQKCRDWESQLLLGQLCHHQALS